ncbi:SirB2 family protein [Reinekea sp.]|jgi:uncharacterized membrane protein SirB2|uniref:SirB2 family protein n=1 Tax=Reinekea sp. TaxID=1970455 RepID=UPI002A803AA2|nr:SirB2 family protein [Reinekea sp.]
MYLLIKNIHMTLAMLSIIGFIVRGPLAIHQHALMQQKWLRILPHIVDTFLLLAAIYLAWTLSLHPLNNAWLLAKVIALVVYIGLGAMVIKRRGSVTRQWLTYGAAIGVFAYILAVAITKNPWLVS